MLQTLTSVQSNTPSLATLEGSSPHHEMVVTLTCAGIPDSSTPCFYNRVGDVTRNVSVLGQIKSKQYVLELNTTSEGYYFCRLGDEMSNEVLLVGELTYYELSRWRVIGN